jgi:hypothetical protein
MMHGKAGLEISCSGTQAATLALLEGELPEEEHLGGELPEEELLDVG